MTEHRGPIATVFPADRRPAATVLLDDDSWVDGVVYKLVVRNGQQWAQVMWRRRQRDHGTLGSFPIDRVRRFDGWHWSAPAADTGG